jgi:hypothetical protein
MVLATDGKIRKQGDTFNIDDGQVGDRIVELINHKLGYSNRA